MLKTFFKWLILLSLIAYAVCAAIWARGEAMKSACRGIEVEIARANSADSVTKQGVLNEIKAYPKKIIGQPLALLDTKSIEKYLGAYSNFENVECSFSTDGTLNVLVTPMTPVLRVFDGDRSYYINKEGKVIESKASFFVDVPVVSGNFTEDFTPRQLLPMSRFVENDPVLSKLIGMIHAKDPKNIILVPRIHGHVINFGDTTRLEEKKRALLTLYKKVMPYKGWQTYDTISVKFQGQIVATRRDKRPADYGGHFIEETDLEESTLPTEGLEIGV